MRLTHEGDEAGPKLLVKKISVFLGGSIAKRRGMWYNGKKE